MAIYLEFDKAKHSDNRQPWYSFRSLINVFDRNNIEYHIKQPNSSYKIDLDDICVKDFSIRDLFFNHNLKNTIYVHTYSYKSIKSIFSNLSIFVYMLSNTSVFIRHITMALIPKYLIRKAISNAKFNLFLTESNLKYMSNLPNSAYFFPYNRNISDVINSTVSKIDGKAKIKWLYIGPFYKIRGLETAVKIASSHPRTESITFIIREDAGVPRKDILKIQGMCPNVLSYVKVNNLNRAELRSLLSLDYTAILPFILFMNDCPIMPLECLDSGMRTVTSEHLLPSCFDIAGLHSVNDVILIDKPTQVDFDQIYGLLSLSNDALISRLFK